ncbi:hypothetical protein V8F33_011023 [Rhypophila sp. PSN 637]
MDNPTGKSFLGPRRDTGNQQPANLPVPSGFKNEVKASNSKSPVSTLRQSVKTLGNGGGSHKSIDEAYQVNSATGSFTTSFAISTTPGRSGYGPSLSVAYDTGSGNGPFGLGWDLGLSTISRKTSKFIPTYNDDIDIFVLSGSDDLVPDQTDSIVFIPSDTGANGRPEDNSKFAVRRFRPRVEDMTRRIEQWSRIQNSQDVHWRVYTSDNSCTLYGWDNESRVVSVSPIDGSIRIFSWLPTRSYDTKGNAVEYKYKTEDTAGISPVLPEFGSSIQDETFKTRLTTKYLKAIRYGNLSPGRDIIAWDTFVPIAENDWAFEVVFDYGEHANHQPTTQEVCPWQVRQDPFSRFTAGFEMRTYRLCRRVLMFHHFEDELNRKDYLVSSTEIHYDQSPAGSFLTSMTRCSHSRDGNVYREPPVEYTYSTIPDMGEVVPKQMSGTFMPLSSSWEWVDLNGQGATGLLVNRGDGVWSYQQNLNAASRPGVTFSAPSLVSSKPSTSSASATSFVDLDKSGSLDILYQDTSGRIDGFVERRGSSWGPFTPFQLIPNLRVQGPDVRMMDLTGSGLQDLVRLDKGTDEVVWYECLAKLGFGPERRVQCTSGTDGPHMITGQVDMALFTADMTGDGLADLVHVSHDQVIYWSNMGYGKFGPPVRMKNMPFFDRADCFTTSRLRLADLDGTGTTDVLYLPEAGGVDVYFNNLGNSWGGRRRIETLPPITQVSSVAAFDLLGTGTTYLCWWGPDETGHQSTRLSYLDMMSGTKPHLMTSITNNMGLETIISYRPSTYYHQTDQLEGNPWQTQLPMPVHCVGKITSIDHVTGVRCSIHYSYHDGYYDPADSEFRGFGMTEVSITDSFAISGSATITQHKTLTKTWFYTGSPAVSTDRFHGDCPPHIASSCHELLRSLETPQNVYRALKGRSFRREVYGELGVTEPCVVEENNFFGTLIWRGRDLHPDVIMINPRETLVTEYDEHNGGVRMEPMRKHSVVVETNEYGSATKSAEISYGIIESTLPSIQDRAKQQETTIVITETRFTNSYDMVGSYRPSLEAGRVISRIHGCTNNANETQGHLYSVADLSILFMDGQLREVALCGSDTSPPVLDSKLPTQIIVGATKQFYWGSSLSAILPFQSADLYSVPHRSYHLALTNDQINNAYSERIPVSKRDLEAAGYVDLDSDGRWWAPSSQAGFSLDGMTPLAAARALFFVPNSSKDPLGNTTVSEPDRYHMRQQTTTDALGSVTRTVYDYAYLTPAEVIDPNGNRTRFCYDTSGALIAQARLGKVGESVGDSTEEFEQDLSQDLLDEFLRNPSAKLADSILGSLNRRTITDKTAFYRSKSGTPTPIWQATLTRPVHYQTEGWQDFRSSNISISFSYFDGSGRQIQEQQLVRYGTGTSLPQWRSNSVVLVNSRGAVIQHYNPFFCSSHSPFLQYEHIPSKPTMALLDAHDRIIGELHPNHTWTKSRVQPWQITLFDAGDTVLCEDPCKDQDVGRLFQHLPTEAYSPTWYAGQRQSPTAADTLAAGRSALYNDSPEITHLDSSHRVIVRARSDSLGTTILTRFSYDVFGNQDAAWDALGRLVEVNVYDFLGRDLYKGGMDFGERCVFYDCLGREIKSWSGCGIEIRTTYDSLGRKTHRWMKENLSDAPKLVDQLIYGESLPTTEAIGKNLRGQLIEQRDQSGTRKIERCDFKGNVVGTTYTLAQDYKTVVDWSKSVPLQSRVFRESTVYDALDRPIVITDPSDCQKKQMHNLVGQIDTVSWRRDASEEWTPVISKAEYTADGQERRIVHGNSTLVTKDYDPDTRLLRRRLATRTNEKSHRVLQDEQYTYDCLDRLIHEINSSHSDTFYKNSRITPAREFTYDNFGRLIKATGRANIKSAAVGCAPSQSISPFGAKDSGIVLPNALYQYSETYVYNAAGNLTQMRHEPVDAPSVQGWTRKYWYEEPSCLKVGSQTSVTSNRLTKTEVGDIVEEYGYEGGAGQNGCMTSMSGRSKMAWDYRNLLHSTSTQRVSSGTPETTWYVYDSSGRRVRKVTERERLAEDDKSCRILKETSYIGGLEIFQRYMGDGVTIKSTVTTCTVGGIGGDLPALLVDTCKYAVNDSDGASSGPLMRYQLDWGFETDENGNTVTYEEYSPFGRTTFAYSSSRDIDAPARYRYGAYERDIETGFCCCGQRYYAPWLGRWTSSDPIFTQDGLDTYQYSGNDPVNHHDPAGTMYKPKTKKEQTEFNKAKVAMSEFSTGGGAINAVANMVGAVDFAQLTQSVNERSPEGTDSLRDYVRSLKKNTKILSNFKIQKPNRSSSVAGAKTAQTASPTRPALKETSVKASSVWKDGGGKGPVLHGAAAFYAGSFDKLNHYYSLSLAAKAHGSKTGKAIKIAYDGMDIHDKIAFIGNRAEKAVNGLLSLEEMHDYRRYLKVNFNGDTVRPNTDGKLDNDGITSEDGIKDMNTFNKYLGVESSQPMKQRPESEMNKMLKEFGTGAASNLATGAGQSGFNRLIEGHD